MTFYIIIGLLGNKINIIYFLLSLLGLYANFIILKRLLNSKEIMSHFYAIIISLILPFFHLYVFNFGVIPFVNIYLDDNVFLYYISFGLSLVSLIPYIITRRLYT